MTEDIIFLAFTLVVLAMTLHKKKQIKQIKQIKRSDISDVDAYKELTIQARRLSDLSDLTVKEAGNHLKYVRDQFAKKTEAEAEDKSLVSDEYVY